MLAGVPRWLHSRPFLLAGVLSAGNLQRRNHALLPAVGVLSIGGSALLTVPVVGAFLDLLAQYPVGPVAFVAVIAAVLTARRRSEVSRSLTDSWLAPLAAASSAPLRMIWPAVLQLLTLAWVIFVPTSVGSLSASGALTLAGALGGAYAGGTVVGWFAPRGAAASAPDFHYVSVRKARANWAQAPRLLPLSYWVVGRARVIIKPKLTAAALLFVLMALPLGTPGEQAMAIAAGVWVLLYVVALTLAVARVAHESAAWLAPTPIAYLSFTFALGHRAFLVLLWTCGWATFLSYAAGLPGALSRGLGFLGFSLTGFLVVLGGTCWMARR